VSLRKTVCVPPIWDATSLSVDFTSEVLVDLSVVEYVGGSATVFERVDGTESTDIFSLNGSTAPGQVNPQPSTLNPTL